MNFDPNKDNERALDEEVAPLLRQLADACERLGMPLLVGIQFSPVGICRTLMLPDNSHQLLMAGAAAMAPDAVELVPDGNGGELN